MTLEVAVGLPRVRFGQIAEFRNGLNFDAAATGQSVKVAGVGSFLQRSRLDDFSDATVVTVRGEVPQESLLRDGDLLFVRSNGSKDLVGRCAMVFPGNERVAFSGFTIRARITSDDVHADYILALARSELFRRELHEKGAGSSITNLSQELLNEVELPLPDLAVQQSIATALQSWDTAINYTERLVVAKRRRKAALVTRTLFDASAKSGCIGDLASVNPRASRIDDAAAVSFVAMEDVSEHGQLLRAADRLRGDLGSGYTQFAEGDVLIAKITPCFENGKGALAEGLTSGVGFGTTEFHVVRPRAAGDADYLHQATLTRRFRGSGERHMTGSAGQRRVPADFISDFQIALHDGRTRREAGRLFRMLDEDIAQEQTRLDRLRLQKRGLMQKLLTGTASLGQASKSKSA